MPAGALAICGGGAGWGFGSGATGCWTGGRCATVGRSGCTTLGPLKFGGGRLSTTCCRAQPEAASNNAADAPNAASEKAELEFESTLAIRGPFLGEGEGRVSCPVPGRCEETRI